MGSTRTSAGLLVFRRGAAGVAFLLVHPGGPLWARRDEGEEPLACALREFEEETGLSAPGPFAPLTPIRQKGGKQVLCWLTEADLDLSGFRSNSFEMEWPPKSGTTATFPEADKAAYWPAEAALAKILTSQKPLLTEALARIGT